MQDICAVLSDFDPSAKQSVKILVFPSQSHQLEAIATRVEAID